MDTLLESTKRALKCNYPRRVNRPRLDGEDLGFSGTNGTFVPEKKLSQEIWHVFVLNGRR